MADLYFTEGDATPEAWATVERVAEEWLGVSPWRKIDQYDGRGSVADCLDDWWAYVPGQREFARAIPLHLAAGRDLAERVLCVVNYTDPDLGRDVALARNREAAGETYPETLRRLLLSSCGP